MSQRSILVLALLVAAGVSSAQESPKKGPRPTYTVAVKVSRAALAPDEQGRTALERSSVTLPDIVTLEGTKAEYATEKKIQMGQYLTRMQVQVQRLGEGRIQVEVLAEDVWSEGSAERPVVNRRSLQTTRQIGLGEKLRFALEGKNEKGEGVWVEMTVKELEE